VIHLLLKMARNVDEAANFDIVQLTEQEPGTCDKHHRDCARQDKTDLVWERISHEMKKSGGIYIFIINTYCHVSGVP
jgi:hypothetical protein